MPDRCFNALRGGVRWAVYTLLACILAACVPIPTHPAAPPGSAAETLTLAGSTAAWPLLDALGPAFQKNHPAVRLTGQEGYGSLHPQGAILEGNVLWAVISGSPSAALWSAPLAVDAIAVIVHSDNPLSSLTLAQLRQVFSGFTWRWSELDVEVTAEDEILVVTREKGSGTRAAFADQVMRERPELDPAPITTMAVLWSSSKDVVAYVAEHPAAIGYVALGVLDAALDERPVKALAIEDVAPGPKQVASGNYPLSLPLFFVARSEPTGVARQFLDFCLSPEGQRIVAQRYVLVRE